MIEDVSRALSTEVRVHLESCPECQRLRDYLSSLEDLNQSLADQIKAPVGFTEKVVDETEKPNQRPGILRYAAPLAAVAILLAGIGWNQSKSQSEGLVVVEADDTAIGSLPNGSLIPSQPGYRYGGGDAPRPTSEPTFVEVMMSDPSGDSYVVRIPSTIIISQTELKRGSLTYVNH